MKIIKDYEVEGCWTGLKSQSKCRLCGTLLETVPKQGHYNSRYWELQKHDEERLVCCLNGCDMNIAESKIKEFLKIRNYCTTNSESHNYKLDFNIIHNAWIDRKGRIFPCEYREHVELAFDLNNDEITLEKKGWLKLTSMEFMWSKKLSQKQIDIIFDYIKIYNKKVMKEFSEKIDYSIGIIKL